jgi:hypothetical protein
VLQFVARRCVVMRRQSIDRTKKMQGFCLNDLTGDVLEKLTVELEKRPRDAWRTATASDVPPASRGLVLPGADWMNRQGRLGKLPWDA